MSALGLGRVKTFALPARVEHLEGTAPRQSPIMLRSRRSIPRYRIVFSTSRRCMSFHTARVISRKSNQDQRSLYFRYTPKSGNEFNARRNVALCQKRLNAAQQTECRDQVIDSSSARAISAPKILLRRIRFESVMPQFALALVYYLCGGSSNRTA